MMKPWKPVPEGWVLLKKGWVAKYGMKYLSDLTDRWVTLRIGLKDIVKPPYKIDGSFMPHIKQKGKKYE